MGAEVEWNRTHEWVIQRHHHYALALAIVFASAHPTADELRRARKLLPELSNEPPARFRQRIVNGRLDLGVRTREDGRAIASLASTLGLTVKHEAAAQIVYVFKNRTAPGYLIVDDADDAERTATEMIAAGVPVVDVEVD